MALARLVLLVSTLQLQAEETAFVSHLANIAGASPAILSW